jgi:hypothetical protein
MRSAKVALSERGGKEVEHEVNEAIRQRLDALKSYLSFCQRHFIVRTGLCDLMAKKIKQKTGLTFAFVSPKVPVENFSPRRRGHGPDQTAKRSARLPGGL